MAGRRRDVGTPLFFCLSSPTPPLCHPRPARGSPSAGQDLAPQPRITRLGCCERSPSRTVRVRAGVLAAGKSGSCPAGFLVGFGVRVGGGVHGGWGGEVVGGDAVEELLEAREGGEGSELGGAVDHRHPRMSLGLRARGVEEVVVSVFEVGHWRCRLLSTGCWCWYRVWVTGVWC